MYLKKAMIRYVTEHPKTGRAIVTVKNILGETVTREMNMPYSCFIKDLDAWQIGGLLIQDAFSSLSPSEREFLLTGLTDDQWDDIVGEQE